MLLGLGGMMVLPFFASIIALIIAPQARAEADPADSHQALFIKIGVVAAWVMIGIVSLIIVGVVLFGLVAVTATSGHGIGSM